MPFFRDAPGIIDGWWCARHQTGTCLSIPNPLPRAIGTRHRHAGDHSSSGRSQATVTTPTTQLAGFVGLDASHRARGKGTHPTHWPAADSHDFPRMRFGCGATIPFLSGAVPRLVKDARRMRVEGGP